MGSAGVAALFGSAEREAGMAAQADVMFLAIGLRLRRSNGVNSTFKGGLRGALRPGVDVGSLRGTAQCRGSLDAKPISFLRSFPMQPTAKYRLCSRVSKTRWAISPLL